MDTLLAMCLPRRSFLRGKQYIHHHRYHSSLLCKHNLCFGCSQTKFLRSPGTPSCFYRQGKTYQRGTKRSLDPSWGPTKGRARSSRRRIGSQCRCRCPLVRAILKDIGSLSFRQGLLLGKSCWLRRACTGLPMRPSILHRTNRKQPRRVRTSVLGTVSGFFRQGSMCRRGTFCMTLGLFCS